MWRWRRRSENDFGEEIRANIGIDTDRFLAKGMSPEEARAAALRAFGNVTHAQERFYESRRVMWLDDLQRDLTHALRALAKNPGFTLVVVLTLALGIGANTAIFSVVNALLLRPLPYKNADRLVQLIMDVPAAESPTKRPLRAALGLSRAEMAEVGLHARTLSQVGTTGPILRGFSGHEEGARLQGSRVSSPMFQMLDARPMIGRTFEPTDEVAGAEPVILLSYMAWQAFFAGDREVLGQALTLDSVLGRRTQFRHTIVGVMPQGFNFPDTQTSFWVPFQDPASGIARGPMVGRLADGASLQAATAEINAILRDVRKDAPQTRYELVRAQDELVAPVRSSLMVLMAAVVSVLLIACVNVTSLLLARMTARQREMAIRTAIGAGRGRLIRQMLTESVILALAGGAAGALLARGGIHLLQALAATVARVDLAPGLAFPRFDEISMHPAVLVFTTASCLLVGVIVGVAPALTASQIDPLDAFRGAAGLRVSRGGVGRRWSTRHTLVVGEIALAVVLLVGGGLLIRSFVNLSTLDPGYNASRVLTFQVSMPLDRYPDARLRRFAEDLVARVRSVPGIEAAAYGNQLPTVNLTDTGGGLWRTPDPARPPTPIGPDVRFVSRDYFRVMSIRIVSGRAFAETDRDGQPRVLLINQTLARRDFIGENPVGQTVYIGRDIVPWQIVGVVNDVRQFGLDREPEPQVFADFRQWSGSVPLFPVGAYYAVRTLGDPMAIVANVRRTVRDLDQQAALFNIEPMEQLVTTTIARPRLYTVLLSIFASVGVVLALIGVYGVTAYGVTQRTREIGIRMALGARSANVMRLVLGQGLMLTAIGMGLGLAGAAAASGYLQGMLFGLTPLDPMTFVAVSLTFVAVAALATFVPARRATKVDPMVALRYE